MHFLNSVYRTLYRHRCVIIEQLLFSVVCNLLSSFVGASSYFVQGSVDIGAATLMATFGAGTAAIGAHYSSK